MEQDGWGENHHHSISSRQTGVRCERTKHKTPDFMFHSFQKSTWSNLKILRSAFVFLASCVSKHTQQNLTKMIKSGLTHTRRFPTTLEVTLLRNLAQKSQRHWYTRWTRDAMQPFHAVVLNYARETARLISVMALLAFSFGS